MRLIEKEVRGNSMKKRDEGEGHNKAWDNKLDREKKRHRDRNMKETRREMW